MADGDVSVGAKSINVFSGIEDDWDLWHVRLQSVLDELGLLDVAEGEAEPTDPAPKAQWKQKRRRDCNDMFTALNFIQMFCTRRT